MDIEVKTVVVAFVVFFAILSLSLQLRKMLDISYSPAIKLRLAMFSSTVRLIGVGLAVGTMINVGYDPAGLFIGLLMALVLYAIRLVRLI